MQQDFQSDALTAISGADYVREKLLATLAIGNNDFNRHVYAIKCRIQDQKSLVDKVIERRTKGDSEYTAAKATDIVGLRFITRFTAQLPEVVDRLLEYLEIMQDARLGLFPSQTVNDVIKEAKVFESREHSSQYKLVYDRLSTLLNVDGKSIATLQRLDERPYSSIHLMCYANGYSSTSTKLIPIEVQFRTVFEDVWAEVDHPRSYKGSRFNEKFEGNPKCWFPHRTEPVRRVISIEN